MSGVVPTMVVLVRLGLVAAEVSFSSRPTLSLQRVLARTSVSSYFGNSIACKRSDDTKCTKLAVPASVFGEEGCTAKLIKDCNLPLRVAFSGRIQ